MTLYPIPGADISSYERGIMWANQEESTDRIENPAVQHMARVCHCQMREPVRALYYM